MKFLLFSALVASVMAIPPQPGPPQYTIGPAPFPQPTPAAAPGPCIDFHVAAVGSDWVSLSWDGATTSVSAPVIDYQILYKVSGTPNWIITAGAHENLGITLRDLSDETDYTFRCKARNRVGKSDAVLAQAVTAQATDGFGSTLQAPCTPVWSSHGPETNGEVQRTFFWNQGFPLTDNTAGIQCGTPTYFRIFYRQWLQHTVTATHVVSRADERRVPSTWNIVKAYYRGLSFVFDDSVFSPNREYEIRIDAVNPAGISGPLLSGRFTTGADTQTTSAPDYHTAPGATVEQLVTSINANSATLVYSQSAGGGGDRRYQTFYRTAAWDGLAAGPWMATDYTQQLRSTVSGLTPDTLYDFAVVAGNYAGRGLRTNIDTVWTSHIAGAPTPAPCQLPPGVSGFASTGSTTSSITLGWSVQATTNTEQQPLGYLIWQATGGQWVLIADVVHPASSYTVSGLQSNVSYQFKLKAYNDCGRGRGSAATGTTPQFTRVPYTRTRSSFSRDERDQ